MTPLRIGPYTLANNLVLAPMAGVTDRPFRQLCRQLGAGLAVSEMVSADTSLWATRKSTRRLDHEGESSPVAAQIAGADPVMMADAARRNIELGAHIIDINMGCPKKKVCRKAAGSALLRNETLVGKILESVVNAVEVPVTLKIRTGWDTHSRNGVRIARIAEASGIQALAVHGRTRACGFAGQAEYATIRDIKRAVSLPVVANGDIDSPQKARAVLEITGADGIMVGRAAQGRPWIFREIAHFLATGTHFREPTHAEVCDILLWHLDNLYIFYGKTQGVLIARKHISWYAKTKPGNAVFRAKINRAQTTQEQQQLVKAFFAQLSKGKEELAA